MRYQVRMEEPSLRSSRRALAGGVAAVLLVGGGGFLIGRGTTAREPGVMAQAPAAPSAPAPARAIEPQPLGVLGRSDLIGLAALASDAVAAGRAPGPEVGEAAGRRFELRLPFGCAGAASETSEAQMRWRYDEADEALRINVAPTVWAAAEWLPTPSLRGAGAVEGFWIARPWTSSEACPVAGEVSGATGAQPVTLPGQTLAVGQILPTAATGTAGGEVERERTVYDAVVRVPRGKLDASKGFRVRISGRIARREEADPVRCRQPLGPEQQPICLVEVVTDEVAIENAASGETLATWNVGTRDAAEN